jgi:hypothetical protein
VLQKLLLNGRFNLSDTKVSDDKVNNEITELSRRVQGKPNNPNIQDVPANITGDFLLHFAASECDSAE